LIRKEIESWEVASFHFHVVIKTFLDVVKIFILFSDLFKNLRLSDDPVVHAVGLLDYTCWTLHQSIPEELVNAFEFPAFIWKSFLYFRSFENVV